MKIKNTNFTHPAYDNMNIRVIYRLRIYTIVLQITGVWKVIMCVKLMKHLP